jgi:hypothetical protein
MISMSRTASVNDICLIQKFHFVLAEIALVPSCFPARKQIIIIHSLPGARLSLVWVGCYIVSLSI